jgi:drug/metabolite transporter (DMT)-like permease
MIYLWIVSLLWSASFGLIGTFLGGVEPSWLALVRLLLSFGLFALFFRRRELSPRQLGALCLLGAVQYGLMYLLLFEAFRALPGQSYLVALFTITTPIYVVLFDDLLERRWSSKAWISIACAIIGAAIIRWPFGAASFDNANFWKGFLLLQGSNAAFASGQIAYRHIRSHWRVRRDAEVFAPIFLGAVLVGALAVGTTGHWTPGRELGVIEIGVIVYLGLVASGLGFFWWNKGAAKVKAETLAVMNNLKIPFAVVVSLLIFGELGTLRPLPFLAGSAFLALALFLAQKRNAHQR